jgi:SAM-dependent methyltransferase
VRDNTPKRELAQALDEVNRRFYERFANEFHQTREHGWSGWHQTLDQLPPRPLRILDLGCGNGRLSQFIDATWVLVRKNQVEHFYGLERCPDLLAFASQQATTFSTTWTEWSWGSVLNGESPAPETTHTDVDWATLFGVMHHIYGYERRLDLLTWAASHLRIGGVLTVSLWDFGAHAKWEKKKLPWTDYAAKDALDLTLLEPGDFLLGWSGRADTPRYCHWVSREEEQRLIRDVVSKSKVGLSHGFRAGDENDLNRYWCWKRTS